MTDTIDPRLEMRRSMPGRPPKYPWDQWLNGQTKLLHCGIHFPRDTSVASLRASVLSTARRRGLVVSTERHADGLAIIFPDSDRKHASREVEPHLTPAEWEIIKSNYRTVLTQERLLGFMPSLWVEYIRAGARAFGLQGCEAMAMPNLEVMVTMKSLPADEEEYVIDRDRPQVEGEPTVTPQQPHLPEHVLDGAFDRGMVTVRPESRAPFTDEQWIDYLADEFGGWRPGNPTFEVDPDTGVMKIEINPRPKSDDE